MGKTLVDLIVEPFLLLFIEYLYDTGLCKCNNYKNDVYNLSIVNKEIYAFIKKYKKLSIMYPEKQIPITHKNFFYKTSYCTKHYMEPLNQKHIDKVICAVTNLLNGKYGNKEIKPIRIIERDIFFGEFIHCDTIEEARALRNWMASETRVGIYDTTCCSGRGFKVALPMSRPFLI